MHALSSLRLRLRQGFQGLALDAAMSEASAAHSLDMLTNTVVGQTGSDVTERLASAFGRVGALLQAPQADATAPTANPFLLK